MTTKDRLQLQREEFEAADELAKQIRRIGMTAVVDDDFPQVKYEFDQAADAFVRAAIANRGGNDYVRRMMQVRG